jgi:hypothetical protein
VKNLAAQTQQTYPQSAAGAAIREALTQRRGPHGASLRRGVEHG